jgi:DNA mismatch repair protein MutS2
MNDHTEAVLDYALIKRDLQAYAVTPIGKALAAQLQPFADAALLDNQLRETSEMVDLLSANDPPPLTVIADIHTYITAAQIEGMYLEGIQLLEVAECLEVAQRLRRYGQLATRHMPLLSRRLARLADFSILLRQIRHALDPQGHVRDHASEALLTARRKLTRLRDTLHTKLHALMTMHQAVVQDAVVTIRNDRFVIPLKADFRQALRGIVHGESASGATVYIEPESVVDLNNHLSHTHAEEERAVREVLRELTGRLAVQRVAVEQALQVIGDIDFIAAKAQLSRHMQGVAPHFTTDPHLELHAARHPLIHQAVPIDVHLAPSQPTLLITGPNTGGKTAVLKTVGLLALMAQSGLHIPASADSQLPVFTDIFVDLGDEQSLQQNLSTFSAHLANICTMMQQVTPRSLVLLDELGAGTDPLEGGALGAAILEYFHHSGAMTLATTHHSVIKAFAMSVPGVACASVDFNLDTLEPRYQLVYGLPGQSKALAIASRLGVPSTVLERAQQELGLTQRRSEELLERLEAERQVAAAERQRLQAERTEVAQLHEEARHLVGQAKQEEQHIRQALYAEGQTLLRTARQEIDATLAALRRQATTTTSIPFPQEQWQQMVQAIASLAPMTPEVPQVTRPFQVGDVVRVRGFNMVGRLAALTEGSETVRVEIGNKTITVSVTELEHLDESSSPALLPESTTPQRKPREAASATVPLAPELRLLGYTVAEALPVLEKYLDQAFVQKLPRLRIIHGVGSGRLREAITALLGRHPLVRRFQAGDTSGGTTIVELERS